MDKQNRRHRLKSESSDEEEDFESADEGDENNDPSPQPPSLKATSPDDIKNSTSKSQVTKEQFTQKPPSMASNQADSHETSELSEKSVEKVETCGDVEAHEKSAVAECTNQDASPESGDKAEHEVLNEDKSLLDDTEDSEIQFKSDKNECDDKVCELEKTQTSADNDSTDHKDAIMERQEEHAIHEEKVAQDEKASSGKQVDEIQASALESQKADTEQQEASNQSSWGWGSWGTMLSQASAGLSSVIETVESSLGIPEPEEIAKKVTEDEKSEQTAEKVIAEEPKTSEDKSHEPLQDDRETVHANSGQGSYIFPVFGLGSVVSGGLEALEYIGKKTMDVISDGDPGLRNRREQLMAKGPTLSQMLREAKEEAEYKAAHPDYKESIMNVKLTTEFDTYQGLAHLEALEILSKESEVKVETHIIDLTKEELVAVKPLLRAIQDVVQIEDEEDENEEEQDFDSEITSSLAELHLSHVPNKTKSVHTRINEWIDLCLTEQTENPKCKDHVEIYTAAISALAELTACTVEQFHKIAEVMLLLAEESDTSALVRAQSLKKLTLCVCREVSNLASKFAAALSTLSKESEDPEAVESLITTLYLESSDSSRYVQHAFKLLCPVLQQSSLSETNSKGS